MACMATRQFATMVVEPPSCLHDQTVSLRVHGLQPGEEITLEASMTDTRGVCFLSHAHYSSSDKKSPALLRKAMAWTGFSHQAFQKADDEGQVDVNTMKSLGGSYQGAFPMGLISSMLPALKEEKFTRFFKRDVENPNIVTLSVFMGHLSNDELVAENRSEPLSTAIHLRHYMAPGVQRIPVRYGKDTLIVLRDFSATTGTVRDGYKLCVGPHGSGGGPFPGVVDMFGSAGGLLEYRSAQLASRGIASLALAFFAYDDLPKTLNEFDISYFEEAVEFLLKHEKIVDGALDCYEAVDDPNNFPETIIPIERANANFLFLVSCDDRNWKSEMYADMAVERLKMAGKRNFKVHKYPGAGHLLEPPFSTFCQSSYHKLIGGSLLWGGTLRPHAEAQLHAWDAILEFFQKNLQNHTSFKGKL
ncbi:Acyl-coenzyme A amino acid N-acyltransferase 2 [Chionoecetes opilio]|uniref:Acyl-coenzyme A amino acid N-acyltransferase 2 n=1 Tax=Chionoecetes opilio TaxID=41210 RepID=A0A8J4XYV9_CHIOP|nr:Acyl-coenzyme A amino acid N-acyltransferase 2 [Chionoecetes opilio]